MKHLLLTIVLLLTKSIIFSQEAMFSFQVIDDENKKPIYGAYLSVNDTIIASSDDRGFFKVLLQPQSIKKICISHLAYTTICFDNLSKLPNLIGLSTEIKQLSEVVVSNSEEVKNIDAFIKHLRTTYKKTSENHYFVPYTLKSVFFGKEQPLSYVEAEGKVIIPSNLNPQIFTSPIWSHCQVRVMELEGVHSNPAYVAESYRFFVANHPLLRNNSKFYSFKVEESEYISGKEYWVVSFHSLRHMKNETRKFQNIMGKMWIDPANHQVCKETFSIDFETFAQNKGTIFYTQVEGYNVIGKLVMSEINLKNKDYRTELILELYIPQLREKYNHIKEEYFTGCYNKSLTYEFAYWANKPITKDNLFYDEIQYLKGNKTLEQAFEDSKNSNTYELTNFNNQEAKRLVEKNLKKHQK